MFYRFDSPSFALSQNVLQIRVAWFCSLPKCSTDSSGSALPSFKMFYRFDCLDTYFFTPRQMFYRSGRTPNRDIFKIHCQNPFEDTSSMTNKDRQQMKMCSIIRGSVLSGICTRENVRFGEGLLEG